MAALSQDFYVVTVVVSVQLSCVWMDMLVGRDCISSECCHIWQQYLTQSHVFMTTIRMLLINGVVCLLSVSQSSSEVLEVCRESNCCLSSSYVRSSKLMRQWKKHFRHIYYRMSD